MRIIECEQYSDPWWEARRGVPTASNFDKLLTAKTQKLSAQAIGYAHQLVGEKYDLSYGQHEDTATAAMRTGTILEPQIRRLFEMERDMDVEQVGFCLTDDGRFGSSPDSLIGDDGVLEIKSPMAKTQVGYLMAGDLPPEYACQCHGHLIVTGRAYCEFISYTPGLPYLLVRVEPNEFTSKLRDALEEFWKIYLQVAARIAECDAIAKRPTVESPF